MHFSIRSCDCESDSRDEEEEAETGRQHISGEDMCLFNDRIECCCDASSWSCMAFIAELYGRKLALSTTRRGHSATTILQNYCGCAVKYTISIILCNRFYVHGCWKVQYYHGIFNIDPRKNAIARLTNTLSNKKLLANIVIVPNLITVILKFNKMWFVSCERMDDKVVAEQYFWSILPRLIKIIHYIFLYYLWTWKKILSTEYVPVWYYSST